MEEIISFEFSNGSKLLDSNVYEYKVGKVASRILCK